MSFTLWDVVSVSELPNREKHGARFLPRRTMFRGWPGAFRHLRRASAFAGRLTRGPRARPRRDQNAGTRRTIRGLTGPDGVREHFPASRPVRMFSDPNSYYAA